MVVCDRESGSVTVTAGERECEVLLLGGEPLNEPIARYGPFVMNTEQQLHEALHDYSIGKFGVLND